ncbi:MAG: hypothetical protein H0V17_29670, partial [Deltaproteobacteria bacterium]|nr:hypothetical protein [Deltaproteobacteria bacterium]
MRWFLAIVMLVGCGGTPGAGGDDDDNPPGDAGVVVDNGEVFQPEVTKVSIEIDFETGNEP